MDGDSKKPLKIVITDFYKLHKAKGKEYTFKQFKKFGVHKATIYRWLKKIEQNGNCDRKSGSGPFERTSPYGKPKWATKPSENLK